MTVIIKIGRRLPRNWAKRLLTKTKGLMTFQENIWIIIDRSLTMAKRKAAQSPTGVIFLKSNYREVEDINFDIEWIEITIRGNPTQEEEEYNEAMGMYKSLGQLFKGELPKDEAFLKPFKTVRLSPEQISNAYKEGYGAMENKSIAQKLLDMGILTHIEKIEERAEPNSEKSGEI